MAENVGMGAAGAIVIPLAEDAGRNVAALIKRRLNYLCCFNSNIQSFTEEAHNLEDTRKELQGLVDGETNNARVILPQTQTWFTRVDEIQSKQKEIQADIPNVQGTCLSIVSRYSLSKKAKKTTEAMMELRIGRSKLVDIAQDAAPPAQQPIPLEKTYEFQSRKQIEESILNALTLAEGNTIFGIAGMGGLGKTTMAERIKHRMMTQGLVDEVVMVVVSQPVNRLRIQLGIAEQLGLKDIESVTTLEARAHKLHERLKGTKRVLIVLDDIWEELNLVRLGIPDKIDSGSCIVLLTSRNEDELSKMNAQVFAMQILHQGEALSLFKEKAGFCVDHPNLMSLVEDVVKECNGLPIALVTLGTALKGVEDPGIWEDARDQLKGSTPVNLQPVLERVYKPLHLSYQFLKNQEAESLFLLCSLFPEDFQVSLDDLTFQGMGLGMFNGVYTLRQARNRVRALVAMLKKHSLLLECERVDHVRMHDVVRDVAIFIASEEERVIRSGGHFDRNCEWISEFSKSSNDSLGHLVGSNFPKLRLMMIHLESSLGTNQHLVLEGKESLNVLSLEKFASKFLPQSIELLKHLRTLRLTECRMMTSISVVGKLLNLEILICDGCDEIEELPIEIGKLTHLKLLHLIYCSNLESIVPGVISELVELEELKVWGCFSGWESVDINRQERSNASLKELESLTKLTCLEIQIQNVHLAEEEIHLSKSLKKYNIKFGKEDWRVKIRRILKRDKSVSLFGWHGEYNNLGSWIHNLGLMSERFQIYGDCPRNIDLSRPQSTVKDLEIGDCETLKKLVNASIEGVFPELENLKLHSLPQLIQICDGRIPEGSNSFKNLCQIDISDCNELQNVFLLEREHQDVFPQLEDVKIRGCRKMEEVFSIEHNGNTTRHDIKFPKLRKLTLDNLPSLTILGKGIESIQFPVLHSLDISFCPNFKSFVSLEMDNHNKVKFDGLKNLDIIYSDIMINMFCQQNFSSSLKTLESVRIVGYTQIRSLFTWRIFDNLVSLESLEIGNCEHMENIIDGEENEKLDGSISPWILPKLKNLTLYSLPNLATFFKRSKSVEFPVLEDLDIEDCPNFISIFSPIERTEILVDEHNCDGGSLHLFCNKQQYFSSSLKTLKKVRIVGCTQIRNLFRWAIFDNLVSLQSLQIGNCEHMESIIDGEENEKLDGSINRWMLPKLKNLKLYSLPNLATFVKGSESVEFPVLENLNIEDCPKFISITSPVENTEILPDEYNCDSGSLHLFRNKQQFFPSSLKALKDARIVGCTQITNLFQWAIFDNLVSLRSLEIGNCEHMESIIDGEENEKLDGSISPWMLPKLKKLKLYSLPNLATFVKGSESVEFPVLENLNIEDCPKFISITSPVENTEILPDEHNCDSGSLHLFCNKQQFFPSSLKTLKSVRIVGCTQIRSLFRWAIFDNLVSLQSLEIGNCKHMESIIDGEENENGGSISPWILPKLENLELSSLPNLATFVKGSESVEFPVLENLDIEDCPKFISITSPVENTEILPDEYNCDSGSLHLFCNKQQFFPSSLKALKHARIVGCTQIRNLFQWQIFDNFPSLESLKIGICEHLENIIDGDENEKGGSISPWILPKLKNLRLYSLPNLATFVKGSESVEFPVLKDLDIEYCPNFISISSPIESTIACDGGSLHLFCNKQVKMVGLEGLKIGVYGNVSNIWCQQIPPYFFKILKNLKIHGCTAIKSLFSTLVVENLVNLQSLSIKRCTKMEKLIAYEDQETINTTIFPSLTKLKLEELPLLGKFSEWKCALEMPLLERVSIIECPQMKFLTPGSISTPHLKDILVDGQQLKENDETLTEIKDLNYFLYQHYLTLNKKMEVNMKVGMDAKDGEDEHSDDSH